MSRFKYRVYDHRNKKMIDNPQLRIERGEIWACDPEPFDQNRNTVLQGAEMVRLQYTGLFDKHRKAVCEGDVVLWGEIHKWLYVFKWIDKFACFAAIDTYGDPHYFQRIDEKKMELMGDVFTNPEKFASQRAMFDAPDKD